jgi:hypothetical protein
MLSQRNLDKIHLNPKSEFRQFITETIVEGFDRKTFRIEMQTEYHQVVRVRLEGEMFTVLPLNWTLEG